jgi:hypothetical protein
LKTNPDSAIFDQLSQPGIAPLAAPLPARAFPPIILTPFSLSAKKWNNFQRLRARHQENHANRQALLPKTLKIVPTFSSYAKRSQTGIASSMQKLPAQTGSSHFIFTCRAN